LLHDRLRFYERGIADKENDPQCFEIVRQSDTVFDLVAYANPQHYVDMLMGVVCHQNLRLLTTAWKLTPY